MKTTVRKAAPWLIALALLSQGPGNAASAQQRPNGVGGRVIGETNPLGAAGVYAYQLADLSLQKVLTDAQGNFLFQNLPAGLYKIIAHKPGFSPVVVMLTRTTATAYQFLELQLAPQPIGAKGKLQDNEFWSIRARIPTDVLRDIQVQEAELAMLAPLPVEQALSAFQTEMQAMTGVDQVASAGASQVSSGGVGFEGRLGQVQVGLRGQFRQLSAETLSPGAEPVGGQSSALSLDLAAGEASRIQVTSLNNRLVTRDGGRENPIAIEHYQVNWTQDVGDRGRSDFAAQYTEENNFHRHDAIDPLDIPAASRSWRVEGAYTASLSEGNTLQAGLRYRERQFGLGPGNLHGELPGQASIDLFSQGGARVRPSVLIEYGLYSTMSDGSLSLSPKGGVVLQLNPEWQIEGNASQRVYQDVATSPIFFPTLHSEGELCEQVTDACYQVNVTRKTGEDNLFSLGAVHRTIGETLRLYFSEDLFFDRLESLYLVRGDELPEVRLMVNRRLSPQVITSLQSSVAMGGGGTFTGADRQTYENQVHYMVTSLDTQFQSTATGVFFAVHHLSQELQPLNSDKGSPQMQTDRVRLMLTQDLNILFDLASQWAVQLNMELSRGPLTSDEFRRRFLGGIAVKF